MKIEVAYHMSNEMQRPSMRPAYETIQSSGVDIRSAQDINYQEGEYIQVRTGFFIDDMMSVSMLIMARSSLFRKHGLVLTNGVGLIDCDYKGEILVHLYCLKKFDHDKGIFKGERIVQGVIINTGRISGIMTVWRERIGGCGSTDKADQSGSETANNGLDSSFDDLGFTDAILRD